MNRHAVGIVARNRWELTYQTLMSMYYSDQPKNSYDLYIIDNASDPDNTEQLREFINSGLLPVKNAYFLPTEVSIPKVWNLFLALADEYEYRVKYDNDLVLLRTTTPSSKPERDSNVPESHPDEVNPLAGAPRSGAIIGGVNSPTSRLTSNSVGIGSRGKKYFVSDNSSRFLDHLTGFATEFSVDLAALAPVPPQLSFPAMINQLANRTLDGRSYLLGSCLQISKKVFDTLGFFDERLQRRIDIEYSQRALRSGFNIGYHPDYWVIHMGADAPTEDKGTLDHKHAFSSSIMQQQPLAGKADSQWSQVIRQIKKASMKYKIVNVE